MPEEVSVLWFKSPAAAAVPAAACPAAVCVMIKLTRFRARCPDFKRVAGRDRDKA